MSDSPKFPRIFHLPFSPGLKNDDRRVDDVSHWLNRDILVTEKMDGSNLCFERDNVYSRSHSKYPVHESFNMAKAEWSRVRHQIPEGVQVFGEWLFAEHSIHYDDLPSYFMVFGVRDLRNGMWWDWLGTKYFAEELGFPTVRVLADLAGVCVETVDDLKDIVRACVNLAEMPPCALYPTKKTACEGVVIRPGKNEQCFPDSEFVTKLCKWVRKDHVQTDEHWTAKPVVRNGLYVPR